jgi:magnesium-transporting ATPase (P-type)
MEQTNPKYERRERQDRHDTQRHGAGRVIVYFIVLIVLNTLLAVYALYMLGIALDYDWTILKSGSIQAILESALQLLLFFSPVILTIILNRLLYRAFRGRGRFPRGTWIFALLGVIVVQAAVIAFIFGYGYVDGASEVRFEQVAIASPD